MGSEELSQWVRRLVDSQVPEGLLLDYKAKPYDLSRNEEKAELAKDVTSFANTQGGAILAGIPEKRDGRMKMKLPDPNYGIREEHDYGVWIRDILANAVAPVLPELRVTWVPKVADASKGVYLIWHPESWMLLHMVHGFHELRYYRRDADRSEPVPMDEQQVDRLYQLRLSGEQRREDFLTRTDFSLDRRGRNAPYMRACLCPRLFLDRTLYFSSSDFRVCWRRTRSPRGANTHSGNGNQLVLAHMHSATGGRRTKKHRVRLSSTPTARSL